MLTVCSQLLKKIINKKIPLPFCLRDGRLLANQPVAQVYWMRKLNVGNKNKGGDSEEGIAKGESAWFTKAPEPDPFSCAFVELSTLLNAYTG